VRRRRAAALLVVVLGLLALFLFVPVPGVPCDVSPAKTCVPSDDAIDLVPQGALAYLHLDTDPDSSQFGTAQDVSKRLPNFAGIEQGLFDSLGMAPGVDLRRDVGSWIGDEAAFAELGPGRSQRLALLAIGDPAGEKKFVARLSEGKARTIKPDKRGPAMHVFRSGLAYAELRDFLVVGRRTGVGSVLDVDAGKAKSLGDAGDASAIRDSLPDLRLADAYVSKRGIAELLRGPGPLSTQLDTFADFAASDGVAAALVAHDDGFELQLDSELGAVRAKTHPSFFQAFPSFDPSLAGEFSPDTLLYLNVAKPADTVRALLRQAAATAPALVASAKRFENDVRARGVDIEKDLLPALGDEAAAGFAAGPGGPYLTLVFKNVDEQRARERMAQLQAPLVAALSPARTGEAPSFGTEKLGDTVVNSVRLSPALDIAYAIFDDKLVISTNPAGVRQAVEGDGSLSGSDSYRTATGGASGGTSALVFLDLEGLFKRAVPLGLGQALGGFSADIAKLKALGLSVKSSEDSLKTTIFLNIE
jgi:hypothetical protein